MSTPELDERQDKINMLKNQHRQMLLSDFIPNEVGGTNQRNAQNGLERMVRGQLDRTMADSDKESRLTNLTALRSSMEVLNSKKIYFFKLRNKKP
jgi:hypothetical protein